MGNSIVFFTIIDYTYIKLITNKTHKKILNGDWNYII